MSIIPKIAVGALGVGGVAGGGVLLANHLSKEALSSRLRKEGYTILEDNASSEWNTVHTKFKGSDFVYPRFTVSDQELKTLQNKCKEVLSKTDASEDDYKKAKKWCVKPTSIKDLLKNKGSQLLNTDANSQTDKGSWEALATKYTTHGVGDKQISGFQITSISSNTNWSQLKEKCKSLSEKDSWWSVDFDSDLIKSELWCIKNSSYLTK